MTACLSFGDNRAEAAFFAVVGTGYYPPSPRSQAAIRRWSNRRLVYAPGSAASRAAAGYRARLDAASIGAGFEAFVSAELIRQDEHSIVAFEQAVLAIPAVVEARRMIGNPDYLMRVVAADLADYERLYTEVLARLPDVQRIGTQIAMRVLKDDAPLPVRLTW